MRVREIMVARSGDCKWLIYLFGWPEINELEAKEKLVACEREREQK